MPTARREMWRSRWFMPAFSLFLGLLVLAAFWIGDRPVEGVIGLVLLTVVGLLFGFGTPTLRGLGGAERDERWAMIDLRATAFAGSITLLVIIGAWLLEIARGHDGSPYGQLGAVAGVAYIVGVALLRRRS
jgi:O-antigen/teichoic acid export membrane protein